jgi:hypothetical protein
MGSDAASIADHQTVRRELRGRPPLAAKADADFGSLVLVESADFGSNSDDDELGWYEWVGVAAPFDDAAMICATEEIDRTRLTAITVRLVEQARKSGHRPKGGFSKDNPLAWEEGELIRGALASGDLECLPRVRPARVRLNIDGDARATWRGLRASPTKFLTDVRQVLANIMPEYREHTEEFEKLGGAERVAAGFRPWRFMFGPGPQFVCVMSHATRENRLAHMIGWGLGHYGCEHLGF